MFFQHLRTLKRPHFGWALVKWPCRSQAFCPRHSLLNYLFAGQESRFCVIFMSLLFFFKAVHPLFPTSTNRTRRINAQPRIGRESERDETSVNDCMRREGWLYFLPTTPAAKVTGAHVQQRGAVLLVPPAVRILPMQADKHQAGLWLAKHLLLGLNLSWLIN